MRRILFFLHALLFCSTISVAQKKPLDHSVYDEWQSVNGRAISNDGKYVVYNVNPQEGDGILVIQATDKSYKKEIPRGYNASITEDSRFVVFKISPLFSDTREARIKKKRPDDMPKDSLAIVEIGKDSVLKIPRVKSFKTPDKSEGPWLAYLLEKELPGKPERSKPDSLAQLTKLEQMADSLARVADSLRNKANEAKTQGLAVLKPPKREKTTSPARSSDDRVTEGTQLVLRNLYTGEEQQYELVNDYYFSEKGNVLIIETTPENKDTATQAYVLWRSLPGDKVDTVMKEFNDVKAFSLDKAGTQLAFVAERDSVKKALQKFYKLWYYKPGMDSAKLRADRNTAGVKEGLTVSEYANIQFSKNGKKLYFGLAPIRPPKDTTLVDFETARLDIWHYNDDYLQPQQLVRLQRDLRQSYLSVMNGDAVNVVQLETEEAESGELVDEGNADYIMATSTYGHRKEAQWQGFSSQTAYIISTVDGSRKLVKKNQRALFDISPKGKYVIWYDLPSRQYFAYAVATGTVKNITQKIPTPVYNDEDDHPDDPRPFGAAAWLEDDEAVLIYDRYDIWKVDPAGNKMPVNITAGYGKKNRTVLRYIRFDREERFIQPDATLVMEGFNRDNKYDGLFTKKLNMPGDPVMQSAGPYAQSFPMKAKNAGVYVINRMTFRDPLDVYTTTDLKTFNQLSDINPQQAQYNWLTAELVKWKMFDGKESEGILYKPEDFDPKKKYPVIFYFYEKNSDRLYNYNTPAPTASIINIAYFVSNGYIVMDPNIYYKDGEPGESAYNSVVSAAKWLAKKPYIDSAKMAIQGQSWGGYQVAYLVTRTKMFAAAGAGAPVANMTSAYGGIRWGSGMNRQFQYERTQSRIGGTLWEKPMHYIENSPIFFADKVQTPVLMMHNDGDGAVPWYQGIEYYMALRRLNKPVWMLNYNGQGHGLTQRQDRTDFAIRMMQYFDHYLKDAPMPDWMKRGVPAIEKGIRQGY